jgi:hypothetical protein
MMAASQTGSLDRLADATPASGASVAATSILAADLRVVCMVDV